MWLCFSWQVIVIGVGTNNHGHSVEQVVDGLLEIVKTCQRKQPQAHVVVMVTSWLFVAMSQVVGRFII